MEVLHEKGNIATYTTGARAGRNASRLEAGPIEPDAVELLGTIAEMGPDGQRPSAKVDGMDRMPDVACEHDLEQSLPLEARGTRLEPTCSILHTPDGSIGRIEAGSVSHLRTISIDAFEVGGRTIRFKDSIHLQERLDPDTEPLVHIEYPDLRLSVYAESQDDMEELILDELANRWEWIVDADDDELTKNALEVKRRFLAIVEV